MLDVLAAERLKLARHRAAWFLVWGYPIGIILVAIIAIVVDLVRAEAPKPGDVETAAKWVSDSAFVWKGPASTFGRYLVAGFTAVAFAGEYGWNTWKLVVPHRARWALMAAKYVTVVGLIYISLALTGFLTVVLGYLGSLVTGDVVPEGITVQALLQAHGRGALLMLAPVLLTVAYTSLAAVLTRSTIAALIIAVVVGTAEEVFTNFAPLLALQARDLVLFLYHVLPGHHLMNVNAWIVEGKAATRPFLDKTVVSLPWGTSLAALVAWIGGLTALTFGLFQRQDLN